VKWSNSFLLNNSLVFLLACVEGRTVRLDRLANKHSSLALAVAVAEAEEKAVSAKLPERAQAAAGALIRSSFGQTDGPKSKQIFNFLLGAQQTRLKVKATLILKLKK